MAVDYSGLAALIASVTAGIASIIAALKAKSVDKKMDEAEVSRNLIARDMKDEIQKK